MPNNNQSRMVIDLESRAEFERLNYDIETQRAIVRAAESRAAVLSARATGPNGEAYREHADGSQGELDDAQAKLEELEGNLNEWTADLEGTRNPLSDVYGNYAPNARVA